MIFILIVLFLAVISIAMAFHSLQGMQKGIHTKEIKRELDKGRVLFHASSSSKKSS